MAIDETRRGTLDETGDEAWDEGAANRGKPPSEGSGEVHGSGAGAGGGNPEDFDAKETLNDDRRNGEGGK